ncbi:unnamed protein product [Arctogadus glacialis]
MFKSASTLSIVLVLTNPRTAAATMLKTEHEALVNHGGLKGIIMCQYRAKYALIFLLLATSGLMFLLRNILTLEKLGWQNSSRAAFAQMRPAPPYQTHTFCSHLGLEPTPDEALEDRYLLKAIAWPKLPVYNVHSGPALQAGEREQQC